MLAALLIVFREVLEAGLVVGIVLAATRSVTGRGRWIAGGVGVGIAGALALAIFAGSLADSFSGRGQEIFNASILGVAVALLAWHNAWMARHGRALSQQFKALGSAVASGDRTLMALALVVGIAVLREGAEVVLFLYGIALSATQSASSMLLGGLSGLTLGVMLGFLTYRGLLKVPTRHLFAVTSLLIALLAAGMASSAIGFLQQADIVTVLADTAWNSSSFIKQDSVLGTLLHALIGYTDHPSQAQVLAYAATLAAIFVLMRLCAPHQQLATQPLRSSSVT
ncbi:MAG: FTR1 family protein [Alphaproteobacteria bacterium]|nr:FTR1 family protein [Alphaproteobacteria bacterium]